MIAAGLIAGSALALIARPALAGVVIMDNLSDVSAVALAAAVLLTAGIVAILPAALRASRMNPLPVLRAE